MSTKQDTSKQGANTTRPTDPQEAAAKAKLQKQGFYLDKNQAAELLGISTRTLDAWLHRRLIPYLKIGRTVRFHPGDLETALLKQHRVAERSAA